MKRLLVVSVLVLVAALAVAQEGAARPGEAIVSDPVAFRDTVDLQMSLQQLTSFLDDPEQLEAIAQRVLILDGVAASVTVFSDDPVDYYVEIELVSGSWQGVEEVSMHRAFVFVDDPIFAGRIAERQGREFDPNLIVRTDRILVAGQLFTVAEAPDGQIVPVIRAFDLRRAR